MSAMRGEGRKRPVSYESLVRTAKELDSAKQRIDGVLAEMKAGGVRSVEVDGLGGIDRGLALVRKFAGKVAAAVSEACPVTGGKR